MPVSTSGAHRPTMQHQLPTCVCKIDGKCLGSVSCSAYGAAMDIDQATLGKVVPSGCTVRRKTGDVVGGLTANQVATVMRTYGVEVETRVGGNVAPIQTIIAHLRAGGGVGAQGNTRALLSRPSLRSTGTAVNHYVHFAALSGGTYWKPDKVLVYDPAANGRKAGWGTAASGPQWWPWEVALAFMADLMPWGEEDPSRRRLGAGRAYCNLVEVPEVNLRFGAVRTKPFPDRQRVAVGAGKRMNVRSRPDRLGGEYVIDHKADGALMEAWQVTTTGASYKGSRKWYGNRTGSRWWHAARVDHEGGET